MIKVKLGEERDGQGTNCGRGHGVWHWEAVGHVEPFGELLLAEGFSRQPLLDACRTIKRLHGVTARGEIGLYRPGMDEPCMVTTVEHGAGVTVAENGPRFAKWKPHPRSL